MNCPECSRVKLKCIDSREYTPFARTRYYVCLGCKKRFISSETLDVEPLSKVGVPKSLRKGGD